MLGFFIGMALIGALSLPNVVLAGPVLAEDQALGLVEQVPEVHAFIMQIARAKGGVKPAIRTEEVSVASSDRFVFAVQESHPTHTVTWNRFAVMKQGGAILVLDIDTGEFIPLALWRDKKASVGADAQTKSSESTQFGIITITTSSTLAAQAGNSYAPMKAMDGDNRTAWVEGAEGDGIGEWIKINYESPMPISGIYFNNGYGKTKKSYAENGRVKEALIETANGSFTKVLADTNEEVQIRIPPNMGGPKHPTKWVKLTIKSVYPGAKYKDTAIAEFRPDLEEHNYSNGAGD